MKTIYTIGHSTHSREKLIELLRMHEITAVGDVRSSPWSRMNPQFNRESLAAALAEAGILYVFLGKELGARSDDPKCYRNGKAQYRRIAETDTFRRGLGRVEAGMEEYRVALMCAEKEPVECHRTILVSRELERLRTSVRHILADGSLEDHAAAMSRLAKMLRLPEEDLFHTPDELMDEVYRCQEERIGYELAAG
jgi:uncharacterized protein (DUF488 family)